MASPRGKDYAAFLAEHFARVTPVDLEKFKAADADGHDVVVLDWSSVFTRDADGRVDPKGPLRWPETPTLPAGYDRPTVLVGAAGGQVAVRRQLKIDILCLCLQDYAHGTAAKHPVFAGPLKVDPAWEDVPTPANYRGRPGGEGLGDTMKMWKVQAKKFPAVDPGIVSDPHGFADSPDAEVVSAGLNAKAPGAVALGRHGNFFLWGFSAPPADMTPAGRACFVNAVHYIKGFDGRPPLVRKVAPGREYALEYAFFVGSKTADATLDRQFPGLRGRFGRDREKYRAYFAENLEYLRPASGSPPDGFVVDEDVQKLGMSNRRVEVLERCVALLEKGEQAELARRVLERYTGESFAAAAGWRGWLNTNRGRLYFTDTGGYRFLVRPEK